MPTVKSHTQGIVGTETSGRYAKRDDATVFFSALVIKKVKMSRLDMNRGEEVQTFTYL